MHMPSAAGPEPRAHLSVVLLCDDEPFNIPGTVADILARAEGCSFMVAAMAGHASFSSYSTNIRRYLALYGPAGFAVRGAQMILLRIGGILGMPSARRHSLRRVAEAAGARFTRCADANSAGFRELLRSVGTDVLISIACPQILRKGTLEIPRIMPLNVHSALLPKNRGMLPTFWSLMADPPEAGVTLHVMSRRLDDGQILLQKRIPANRGDTSLHQLLAASKRAAADLIVDGLAILRTGRWELLPNPAGQGTVNGFPTASDVREFRRRGGRIW